MEWSENIIIADGDYVDRVAFNLIVNFERMIGRRIPQADMARWVECIALDGGMRPGSPGSPAGPMTTQVVLIHDDGRQRLENFVPGHYADELHGKAFSGNLGEFVFTCTSPEGITTKAALLQDTLLTVCHVQEVKRIMVVADEQHLDGIRRVLRQTADGDAPKRITVFAMQPISGGQFCQELLGYSLMAALGVKGSELRPE